MNPATLKSFDRLLRRMERNGNRPNRRLTASPFVLTLGLILTQLLLSRLVPMLWATLLPGGLDQATQLRGWAGLLWKAVCLSHDFPERIAAGIAIAALLALILSYRHRSIRFLVWLGAASVIALNAAILFLTLRTSMAASALDLGIGLE